VLFTFIWYQSNTVSSHATASNYRLFIKVYMGRIQYSTFHFSFSPFSKADEHQGRKLINTPPWHSSHKINTSASQLANATQAFPSNTSNALHNVLLMTLERSRNAITLQPYDFLTLNMFIRRENPSLSRSKNSKWRHYGIHAWPSVSSLDKRSLVKLNCTEAKQEETKGEKETKYCNP